MNPQVTSKTFTKKVSLRPQFKAKLDELILQDDLYPREGISWENLKESLKPKKRKRGRAARSAESARCLPARFIKRDQ